MRPVYLESDSNMSKIIRSKKPPHAIDKIIVGTTPKGGFPGGVPSVIQRAMASDDLTLAQACALCENFAFEDTLTTAQRIESIRGAIAQLDARDDKLWTKSSKPEERKPHFEPLEKILGWKPTAEERDTAWAQEISEE